MKANLNEIKYIDVEIREHWQGIFNAHPWLDGPQDSYLGFWKKGGGAISEHSHGINIWQFFTPVDPCARPRQSRIYGHTFFQNRSYFQIK